MKINGDAFIVMIMNKRLGNSNSKRHGMSATKFGRIFYSIRNRCNNPGCSNYSYYGGKGIRCEWATFEQFYEGMFESYQDHVSIHGDRETTIERLDNSKGYATSNCRWATRMEQASNKRNNFMVEYAGEVKTLSQWSRELGVPRSRLKDRIQRLHWTIEEAIQTEKRANQYA